MTFSFVILNYDGWEMTHRLLFDIYQNCTRPDEVLIVNNGCKKKESFEGTAWWIENGMLPVRELRIEENIGFLLGANEGLKEADTDIICLVSNDVRIHKDIVTHIDYQIRNCYKSLIGGRLLDWDTGWNTFGNKMFPYVEGWLLATTKDNWKELNYFDELYVPNDMEDLDLSATAKNLNYMLVSLPEDYTSHHGAQTISYGSPREELTKRNKEKFRQKWGLA
jgi:GT2 family glycosyltransferase